MSKPINVYAVSEARQAFEEALPGIFSRLGYTQTFKLIDTKLFLGYSLVVFAAASFLLDKKLTWEESKQYQLILVSLYAVVCGVQWWFNKFVEKGIIYQGTNKDNKISIGAKFKKNSHEFHIYIADSTNQRVELETSFTKFFNEQGYLQTELLYNYFKQQTEQLVSKKSK
ncbi:signal peptidase complex subunit SPC2 [Kluyveromyces marxianus]|uniref:Signal peptidase complex subunit 2 n=2 Tax=Kluyveromyces marxianus TaxID=4911 RepID=W0T4A5_KLUMD|nr:signal peptidase complex subunit SPC2 [Kluyveromyces marxianus DMKU3-1042]QGN13580.1 signal peptidase complex subunit SPC2 [Kluyveromyces marxianus]BAO38240.1 signal peptidase complex subunit SPC2 [Kluyveromyces marxianus DMKU3-1042]BAP69806.1 signal peptidase complex subunit SPC2 [Kluyveromyces marxianus]